METHSIERTHSIPSESNLRSYDMMGGLLAVVMVLGPLLAGAFR